MADFCKQCSIEIFDHDFGELANLLPLEPGSYLVPALCEGCGFTPVNEDGISMSFTDANSILAFFFFAEEYAYAS